MNLVKNSLTVMPRCGIIFQLWVVGPIRQSIKKWFGSVYVVMGEKSLTSPDTQIAWPLFFSDGSIFLLHFIEVE